MDSHLLQHVHQVLGGYHHRGLSHPAIRTARHAADRRLQAQRVAIVEHAQRRVDGSQRRAPGVVQMQVEIGDRRPALLDLFERALDLVRQVPARCVRKADALHREPRVVPLLNHAIEHRHQLFSRHFAGPVGAKAVADVHAAVLRALRDRLFDHLRPCRDLLGLRAVRVALREHVAHIDAGRVLVRFGRQRRREFLGALEPFVVQRSVRVAHTGLGVKRLDELVHARHLRRPLRAHERADRDFPEAGLRQRIEQADLGFEWNIGTFDLQPVAHAFFGMNYFRIAAHDFTFIEK